MIYRLRSKKGGLMRFIPLIIFLTSALIYTQPRSSAFERPLPVTTEVHVIPGETKHELFYSFRVPYNIMVFEKKEMSFLSEYELLIEITDKNGAILERKIVTKEVSVMDYKETNSGNLYSEGEVKFDIPSGILTLVAVFTDKKNNRELRLLPVELTVKPLSEIKFLTPVIVETEKIDCGGKLLYRHANSGGNIPFSEEKFSLIIPAGNKELTEISVEIFNNDSIYWSGTVSENVSGRIFMGECSTGTVEIIDSEESTLNFILNGVSGLLPEGNYGLRIKAEGQEVQAFEFDVRWFNRPVSLSDPEYAINSLKYIIKEDELDEIKSHKNSELRKALAQYWRKIDPTPETEFNPLMHEYYQRIDYAGRNFASLFKKDGSNSDRGMIFIKFGEPLKIERSYNNEGNIIETWLYKKNKFIFVDKKGTGEFLLMNG